MIKIKPWVKVRAGWYQRQIDELWFHIIKENGVWNGFVNEDKWSVGRYNLVISCCFDLMEAKIEMEEKIRKLTNKGLTRFNN